MVISNKKKIFHWFLLLFWTTVIIWQFNQMNASGFDKPLILSSNDAVSFQEGERYFSFIPKADSSKIAILFFPGALVEAEAYSPLAKRIAEKGYSVYIQKIPYRIAITDNMENKALNDALTQIKKINDKHWVIAGHSRGGRMAANFANKHPESFNGLLLLGTSHPKEHDLSNLEIPVLKLSASEDGLASPPEIKQFSVNLPKHTNFVMIEGGNHSNFGYYGFQLGAGTPLISREQQQEVTLNEILNFLRII